MRLSVADRSYPEFAEKYASVAYSMVRLEAVSVFTFTIVLVVVVPVIYGPQRIEGVSSSIVSATTGTFMHATNSTIMIRKIRFRVFSHMIENPPLFRSFCQSGPFFVP